jgi:Fe-S cluster biosynthesis and repair protein YggX
VENRGNAHLRAAQVMRSQQFFFGTGAEAVVGYVPPAAE